MLQEDAGQRRCQINGTCSAEASFARTARVRDGEGAQVVRISGKLPSSDECELAWQTRARKASAITLDTARF